MILTTTPVWLTGNNTGTDRHGFRLIEKRFVKEVNAECYFFEHIKSGAHLFKIASNDPNKTFSIGFKTFPESDNGAPHIMEHSVLNGSKNFPVKSPFDILNKGSLNTFINAFTGKDMTMYPVASMNDKDYFNLMHVYLDAVFNPLIYTEPRILKQEGWHYELTEVESPIVFKGVVYNEMKGAFSSPSRELSYQVFKNLFPNNGYGYESGGHPASIPTLTYEYFINFHKRFYHPGNSYIFLYGNADLDKELEFINDNYLSNYGQLKDKVVVDDQKPFEAMKDITANYSVMEGSETANQAYLSYNVVAGHNMEIELTMALDIICEAIVNQESAPLRLALQEAGIGQDVYAYNNSYKQNVVQIIVQNANASDKEKFYNILNKIFNDAIKNGIDKETIQGILNRIEFQLREGNDAQKGLTYITQSLPGCFFANDPFVGLEYEKSLAKLKKMINNGYLEKVIAQYFINNPHTLLLTLVPQPGLDKEKNIQAEQELKKYKENLNNSQITSLVNETQELIAYQKREDSPEALQTIPLLDIKDINPKAEWYGVQEKQIAGVKVLHHEEFTNDVVYANLYFDMRVLPENLIPYASLLSNLLGLMDTEKYSFGDLNKVLNIHTGGFNTFLSAYAEDLDDNKLLPKFVVSTKAMNVKADKLFELTQEVLLKTHYNDTARLHALLSRFQGQLDARIKRSGANYTSTRFNSYITNKGQFNELTDGVDYYWFITDLSNNFNQKSQQIAENLKTIATLLFTKDNLIAANTGSSGDGEVFNKNIKGFISALPVKKSVYNQWTFTPEKKNEGLQTASKVQYVIQGYDFKKLGYKWDGKMRVLNQILSTDWLQTQIRVIGGAYGGYSTFSPGGIITFNSYRDPNLSETLNNYSTTPDYLHKFTADEKAMTRYIIGTIAGMDDPLTPSQKGTQAVSYYFTKRSAEDIQNERNAILSTTQDDIRGFAGLIQDILDQKTYCVYGNAEKIDSNKDLFKQLVKLQ